MLGGIEAAANGHIAATEHDGMSAVIDGIGTDVQSITCGNDRGCTVLCRIGHSGRTNGNMIAIDSSGTEVVQGLGFKDGFRSVDGAPVG